MKSPKTAATFSMEAPAFELHGFGSYWDYLGIRKQNGHLVYWGYVGITENKMEPTIVSHSMLVVYWGNGK